MEADERLPLTLEEDIVLVHFWIILKDDMFCIGLLHLMYKSLWLCLKNVFQYDLSHRVYQTKDEMKTKLKDLTKEVKIFNKIYHNIDNELSNEDKDVFL